MKKITSIVLIIALLAFLCVTNPTTGEFADWYAEQAGEAVGTDAPLLGQAVTTFSAHLAQTAQRESYMVCSVFSYGGHKTLGIGLMFFPIDSLSQQAGHLRDAYADWLEHNAG